MSLCGTGAVCIWHDVRPEAKDEFYQWHNREHMPERVAIPGFRMGRRYIAIQGAPEYFNLYEADSAEVLCGADYMNRLNAPTEWTRRVVPSFLRVSRSICRVAYTSGVGQGGFMLTHRFDVAPTQRNAVANALIGHLLPPLAERKGVAGVHLCLADEAASKVETAEKKVRADTTLVPTWIMLVEGSAAADVLAAGELLASGLRGLSGGAVSASYTSVYQHEHTCCRTSLDVTGVHPFAKPLDSRVGGDDEK